MRLRHLMIVNAAFAAAVGLWFSVFGAGDVADAYGLSAASAWAGPAIIRLLGVAMVAFGLLCWLLRDTAEAEQRRVAGVLSAFFAVASLLVWGQQHAIWDYTVTGWLTLSVFVLEGLAFGAFFLLGPRAGSRTPLRPAVPPTGGDHTSAARP